MEIPEPLKQKYNVNDNVAKSTNNNVIVNVTEGDVNRIAEKLCDRLNNPSGRLYYCKVAWELPESSIWKNLETALTGKDPKKYFTWLCNRELKKGNR